MMRRIVRTGRQRSWFGLTACLVAASLAWSLRGSFAESDAPRPEAETKPPGAKAPTTAETNAPAAVLTPPRVKIGAAIDLTGIELPSAEGRATTLSERLGEKGTVLVCMSTECPISNGYVTTLNRLVREYAERGVRVVAVDAQPRVSLSELDAWRREYRVEYLVLKDPEGRIGRAISARVSPEAAVLDGEGRLRYRGRIDDRYAQRGGAPREPRTADLALALDALLAGRPIATPETEAIGCPLPSSRPAVRAARDGSPVAADVTYHERIAGILQRHCVQCHRPGGVGPFSLTTFEQAVSWADDVRRFTADRTMPPWLPVDGHGDFANRRAMSAEEIDLVKRWVDAGCPAGDARRSPPPRVFVEGWQLGEPDRILEPAAEYEVAAEGPDEYRCFVLPTDFGGDRFVTGFEVRPGNAAVVHHVIAFVDAGGKSRELDAADPAPGYATKSGFPGFFPSGGLGGWAPGNSPRVLPEGMAKVLPQGASVVLQVHYHRTGKPERDRTRIGLHFAKGPVTRAVQAIPVMPFGGPWSGMRIPAGAGDHEVRASVTLPKDVLVLTVTPHMHLLGKDMRLTATRPDGSVERMLLVDRWNFDWQESYKYRTPLRLPQGTRLDLVAHLDNSEANPRNPQRPPQLVRWGEQTTDEMCIAFLEIAPVDEAKSPGELRAPRPGDLLREALLGRVRDLARSKPPPTPSAGDRRATESNDAGAMPTGRR